jgi:hypothetical protein
MTAVSAPFGLRPARHRSAGLIRTEIATIATGYASTIYKGAPVKMLSDGTIGLAAAGDAFVGVLMGVEYNDSLGKPTKGHWIANTAGTDIVAYITTDPDIIYHIQATATLAQTHVGNLLDISNEGTGVALEAGTSTATANAASVGTVSAQLQILGFRPGPDNVQGDAFPILEVRIAEHQLSGWDSAGAYAADAGV